MKLKCLPLFVLSIWALLFSWMFAGLVTADESSPNIVFIFADDWGWGDLGCHGHPYLKTPNLDRLAQEGTEYYQFTVASGVCSPSRAAVITGHFPARHSIHGHFATVESHQQRGMPDWLDPEIVLLPRLLKSAGYATAHYGKWHLTNIMVPDAPRPDRYGYDKYGVFNCSGEQMPVHDDVENSIAFIEQSVKSKTPFFLNLWIHEPHTPHYPKKKYLQQFAHLENEADRIYAAVLAHADARIGQLLETLEELNVTGDTLVIFSSDNGPEYTGPPSRRMTDDRSTGPGFGTFASVGTTGGHRGQKRSLLQGGVGVPFIVRWPEKVAAGKIDDVTPITAVDLLPTFCEAAGVSLPADYHPDGVSQLSVWQGKTTPNGERKPPILWDWRFASPRRPHWPEKAVRSGDWKLVVGRNGNPTELFRFPEDRLEQHDLSERHPEVVTNLKRMFSEWQATLPKSPNPDCFSKTRN
ncbi:MAG: sulfatase-like hydrolase/transferase [Planctomycetaceae bacterium]|nr:sulfatase-like hydrolase/transferase [Planctomycetaceae bacterium]